MRKCSVYTRDIMTSVRNRVLWSFRCPFQWNHQVWPLHCVSAVIKPQSYGRDFFSLTMDSPENQEKVYLTAAQGENGAITLEVSIFDWVWLSTHINRRRQTWSWIVHWFWNAAVDESALCNIRPRSHVSGYFLMRNFFFPDTKVSTYSNRILPSTRIRIHSGFTEDWPNCPTRHWFVQV